MAGSSEKTKQEQQLSHRVKAMEVEHLSQKMTALSTNTVTREAIVTLKDCIPTFDQVPSYLRKCHSPMQKMLRETLISTATPIRNEKIEELRRIALIMYKVELLQLHQHLWMTYLKAGTGQLIRSSQEPLVHATDQAIWPKVIKQRFTSKATSKSLMAETYQNFVQQALKILHTHLQQYQLELTRKIEQSQHCSSAVQHALANYLEQHLQPLRRQIEHEIQLVHLDYHIAAIKLEYRRHQPNRYQQKWMKQLCQEKYEQEMAEQEYRFLHKQVAYYSSPTHSFDASSLAHSSLIESIEDPVLRQEFYNRFKQVAEEGRAQVFDLCRKTAEKERLQCREKYNASVKKMWSDCLTARGDQQIPRIMTDLTDRCCTKISQRIQCIYLYKEECIGLDSK